MHSLRQRAVSRGKRFCNNKLLVVSNRNYFVGHQSMAAVRWSWRRSAPVVPTDAVATRRPSLREMESISLMSRARRLRVSLPLLILAALLLSTCNTLAFLLRPATDGENTDALLPRLLLQGWIPCSHLFGPPLLLALQPCDR